MTSELRLVFDDRILAEYRDVLYRERFGFNPDDVDDLLDYLQAEGELIVATPLSVALPDPDDEPFLEVAVASDVVALITGNIRHYPVQAQQGVSVMLPAEFITWWQNEHTSGVG